MSCFKPAHVLLQTYTCPVANLYLSMSVAHPVTAVRSPLRPRLRISTTLLSESSCKRTHVLFQTYTCPVVNIHMFYCKHAHVLLNTNICPVANLHMSCYLHAHCKKSPLLSLVPWILWCGDGKSYVNPKTRSGNVMQYTLWVGCVCVNCACPVTDILMSCRTKAHVLLQWYICPVAFMHMSCWFDTHVSNTCPVVMMRMSCCILTHVLLHIYILSHKSTCPVAMVWQVCMSCCICVHVLLLVWFVWICITTQSVQIF